MTLLQLLQAQLTFWICLIASHAYLFIYLFIYLFKDLYKMYRCKNNRT